MIQQIPPQPPVLLDFRPVVIECQEPSGPYTIRCARCAREWTVRTVEQAVRLRSIHVQTYRHTHPNTRPSLALMLRMRGWSR